MRTRLHSCICVSLLLCIPCCVHSTGLSKDDEARQEEDGLWPALIYG